MRRISPCAEKLHRVSCAHTHGGPGRGVGEVVSNQRATRRERDSERMSCGNSGRSDDEDQGQTYYAISNYTAVEDSQVLL